MVHLAGNPDPEAPWDKRREPNVEGFAGLLAAARGRGVRRVVFASSVHATDMQRIVIGALETDVKFEIYHAVSWPSRRRWDIDATISELGYQPEADDDAPAGGPNSDDDFLTTCRGRRQDSSLDGAEVS